MTTMTLARRWLTGLLIAAAIGMAAPRTAHAGMPVIDAANLAQAIEQVMSWARQYQQMEREYMQLRAQYNSITGARGLGDLMNNPALRQVVPNDLVNIYNAVNSGSLSGAAAALRASQRLYDCQGMLAPDQARCRTALNLIAESQTQLRQAYERVVSRTDQIEELRARINETEDLKEISELQGRMQAEIAQVANDQNKIQSMKMMHDLQREQSSQSRNEALLRNLQSNDDGLNGLGETVAARWRAR